MKSDKLRGWLQDEIFETMITIPEEMVGWFEDFMEKLEMGLDPREQDPDRFDDLVLKGKIVLRMIQCGVVEEIAVAESEEALKSNKTLLQLFDHEYTPESGFKSYDFDYQDGIRVSVDLINPAVLNMPDGVFNEYMITDAKSVAMAIHKHCGPVLHAETIYDRLAEKLGTPPRIYHNVSTGSGRGLVVGREDFVMKISVSGDTTDEMIASLENAMDRLERIGRQLEEAVGKEIDKDLIDKGILVKRVPKEDIETCDTTEGITIMPTPKKDIIH